MGILHTGGFANSPLRLSVATPAESREGGGGEAVDEVRAVMVRAAAAARSAAAGVAAHLPLRPLNLRHLMKSGTLAGQAVQFRSRNGDMVLTGMRRRLTQHRTGSPSRPHICRGAAAAAAVCRCAFSAAEIGSFACAIRMLRVWGWPVVQGPSPRRV